MNKLVQAAATAAARYTIRRNMADFDAGRVTHQSIYFQLGKALQLQEPDLSRRARQLIAQRANCTEPANVSDVIIRDSLNQFANLLPGSTDVRELIKNTFRNSYQSMVGVRNLVLAEKRAKERSTKPLKRVAVIFFALCVSTAWCLG